MVQTLGILALVKRNIQAATQTADQARTEVKRRKNLFEKNLTLVTEEMVTLTETLAPLLPKDRW